MIKVANNLHNLAAKQAFTDKAPLAFLNPTSDQLYNYGILGGGGGILGAGIGALVNKIRDEDAIKGALIGALLGTGGGLLAKGTGDAFMDANFKFIGDQYRRGKRDANG